MKRLKPPPMGADDSAARDVVVECGPTGIGRDDVLDRFRQAMTKPYPEAKALKQELRSWSGILGGTDWFADAYSPIAALMMASPSVTTSEMPVINTIMDACVRLVAPLGRYSAGWGDSLREIKPRMIRAITVREAERQAVRDVRKEMAAEHSELMTTQDTVREFLTRPQIRHDRDEAVALVAYLTVIAALIAVDDTEADSRVLSDAERATLAELVDLASDERGIRPRRQPSAAELGDYRTRAVDFLNTVIAERYSDRRHNPDHLAEAFERMVITYVNRQILGKPLEGTEHYLGLRLTAVRIDTHRRAARRNAHEKVFVAGDDPGSSRADDRVEDTTAASAGDDGSAIFAAAAAIIATDSANRKNDVLTWEAELVVGLLEKAGRSDIESVAAHLPAEVAQAWAHGAPANACSRSATAARMHIQLLIESAITRAGRQLGNGGQT